MESLEELRLSNLEKMSNRFQVGLTWYKCGGEGPAHVCVCCSSVAKAQQGFFVLDIKAIFQAMR